MSKLFEELVKKRGFTSSFLKPEYEGLPSPWLLPDMKKAVGRISEAVKRGEKVIIYGDYDVDGVTASTVLGEALRLAGAKEVEVMLPDRFKDGYGMSEKVVERAKETGASLVVTADCGSGNKEIVAELKKEGVETIVTDHHECPKELPEAVAVVNPKRRDVAKCVPEFEEHL
ncbi:DHH family phosphoesterase, partial [Candidatus Saccharibacteria bacterium]|nr:DHH family phosphoesterase [Candidatus Saccharibacteria bacterium]